MGIFAIFKAPLRLLHRAWVQILPSHDTRTVLALPVAGLDEAIAHQILSTLRSAASTEEVFILVVKQKFYLLGHAACTRGSNLVAAHHISFIAA